jgi:hypothetical protein
MDDTLVAQEATAADVGLLNRAEAPHVEQVPPAVNDGVRSSRRQRTHAAAPLVLTRSFERGG